MKKYFFPNKTHLFLLINLIFLFRTLKVYKYFLLTNFGLT